MKLTYEQLLAWIKYRNWEHYCNSRSSQTASKMLEGRRGHDVKA